MTLKELEFFKNYNMDDNELYECHSIVDCINKHKTSHRTLQYGFPQDITNDLTEGYSIGSIMCIRVDHGYNYYLFQIGEKGTIDCIDFEKTKQIYKKIYSRIISKDAFIHFLFKKIDSAEDDCIYLHNGFIVKAHLSENNKYYLETIIGYGSGMAQDIASIETGWKEPIYDKITCINCKIVFFSCGENEKFLCPVCITKN